ncbi:Uncharacterised protein [Mycobacteroides abscessus subsp. abscessus]|nr:Uncharacterised protein [Mycobacteroides abscessus subsp. abscessus]
MFRNMLSRRYTLFTGAGFSVNATGRHGNLPVGSTFADLLRQNFEVDTENLLTLPQIYTILDRTRPTELLDFINDTYTVMNYDPDYDVLKRTPPTTILTTNVDDLFESIFSGSQEHYLNNVYLTGSAVSHRTAIDFIQVHGSVRDLTRKVVFGPFDLAAAFATDPDRWYFIRQCIASTPTLYWGYSFSDPGTLQAMRSSTGVMPIEPANAWVQIRPGPNSNAITEYYRMLGLSVIVAQTTDLLRYFADNPIKREVVALKGDHNSKDIPAAGEVPTRPIEDFFQGASPIWSDIHSGRIYKTGHYARVAELIHAGENIVIAGIPGCGKTTLLMQLAFGIDINCTKLFHRGLSHAEGKMLLNALKGSHAVAFFDDIASDIRVLELFIDAGIQVVGADRDFSINSVDNRLASKGVKIVGVSGLDRQDMVSIWRSVPQGIRKGNLTIPAMAGGMDASIYEIVKANIRSQTISERLLQHLRQIESTDPDMAKLLVLSCYVMYARSTLSSDLAMAFFRESNLGYEKIIGMTREVGDLLLETNFHLDDQDYFTTRSTLVADEILYGASASLLKETLVKFYSNVSPWRVPSFDIFRRRAYDAKLFDQAFRSSAEGTDLYDKIMERDPSPYVLQQKALYLSKRGLHKQAFREIESARDLWRGRTNWGIENTYYKVLFYSNVDLADRDGDAFSLCTRALEGLATCFSGDRRKGNHAIVYSDCTLKYSELETAADSQIIRSLHEAERMLTIAVSNEAYLRKLYGKLRAIKSRLRNFE